jgi:predicted PurR-regulated permease PerM
MQNIKDRAFILFLASATIAFAWILRPFYGTILWGLVIAILFHPLNLHFRKMMGQRKSLSSGRLG